MNILSARYAGSTHDSFIWKSSMDFAHLQNEHDAHPDGMYLLGDSGYPLQPFLMTPIASPQTPAERNYNEVHSKTRNKVERCIGVLKTRFRCLCIDQKLRYNHTKSAFIVYSCVILHNFLNSHNFAMELDENVIELDNGNGYRNNVDDGQYLEIGRNIRNGIIQTLFNR